MMLRKVAILPLFLALGLGAAHAQSGKKSSSDVGQAVVDCTGLAFSGEEMTCTCPSNAPARSVWGSGPYTADSDICTAARHAGAISANGGRVHLLARPGQSSYSGTSANGITTSGWGAYGQSYAFAGVKSRLPACGTIPAGVDEYACSCPADVRQGSVWGNGPYTADSDICTAALHAGYIDGTSADVYVLRVQGLSSYHGGEGNGVTTSDWGAYGSSIVFDWNR